MIAHRVGLRLLAGLAVVGLYGGLVVVPLAPEGAAAHGQGSPNLSAYCKKKHKGGLLSLKAYAKYNARKRRWECVRDGHMGFNTTVPGRTWGLDMRDACWQGRRIGRSHTHRGGRVVHCGAQARAAPAPGGGGRQRAAPAPGGGGRQRGAVARRGSTLTLCNRSSKREIFVAYAVYERYLRGGGWTSNGWWRVTRNQCRDFPLVQGYRGDTYVYAQSGSDKWTGNDAAFCVHRSKGFAIRQADSVQCGGRNLRHAKMSKFAVRDGRNIWNFR